MGLCPIATYPEQGGTLRIALPDIDGEPSITGNAGPVTTKDGVYTIETKKGEWVDIKAKN